MPRHRVPAVVLAALAFAIGGCGANPSPSGSPAAGGLLGSGGCGTDQAASPAAAGTSSRRDHPPGAADIDAILVASSGSLAPEPNRHAAPELEALIPQTIAGAGFRVESFQWAADPADTLTPLVGKHAENMCYAFGTPLDPAKLAAGIEVYRIVGVPAIKLRAAMLTSSFLTAPSAEQTVGGKQVIVARFTGSPMQCCSNGPVYLYANGEALFLILPANADAAASVLRALP